jgi:hypothetical protein
LFPIPEIEIVRFHLCLLGVVLSHLCALVCSGKRIALAKVVELIQEGGEESGYLIEDGNVGAIN